MRTKLIIIIVLLMILAGVGGYFFYNQSAKDPVELTYNNIEEIKVEIDRLEIERVKTTYIWQDAYMLGVAYFHAGMYADAVDALDEASRMRPQFRKIFETLGMANYKNKNFEAALKAWQRALAMAPDSEHLKALVEQTKYHSHTLKRTQRLEAALNEKRIIWRERLELASFYAGDGRFEDAMVQLDEVLKEQSENPEVYDVIAYIHAIGGNYDEAIRAEEKAIAFAPDEESYKKKLSEMKRLRDSIKTKGDSGYHDPS
jgi:tetratricopeptide (TPR) repeat protein